MVVKALDAVLRTIDELLYKDIALFGVLHGLGHGLTHLSFVLAIDNATAA